jgi:cytochrome c553
MIRAIFLAVLVAASVSAEAAPAAPAKSAVCIACHGPAGISMSPIWPNLAGQKKDYLAKQIKAFRDGTRTDPSMSPMAKGLTDAEVEELAAYYSSL